MDHDSPCFNGATCLNTGSGSYVCEDCPAGYRGNGDNCTDINEVCLVSKFTLDSGKNSEPS